MSPRASSGRPLLRKNGPAAESVLAGFTQRVDDSGATSAVALEHGLTEPGQGNGTRLHPDRIR